MEETNVFISLTKPNQHTVILWPICPTVLLRVLVLDVSRNTIYDCLLVPLTTNNDFNKLQIPPFISIQQMKELVWKGSSILCSLVSEFFKKRWVTTRVREFLPIIPISE
jgi:hypothetical protein